MVVPADVCVTTDFQTRAGNSVVAGDNNDGFDVHSNVNAGATATPRVNITGEVDLGEFRVMNDDNVDVSRNVHGDRPDRSEMASNLTAACSAPAQPDEPGGKRG